MSIKALALAAICSKRDFLSRLNKAFVLFAPWWDLDVAKLRHAAAGYLDYLCTTGAPVHSRAPPKTPAEVQAAADRGPHLSAIAHREFLWGKAYKMCQRWHAMVLPLSAVKDISGVQVSPLMVAEQRDRRLRTLCDLTYSRVNENTVSLAPNKSTQFGRALQRLLLQIYRADPRWGPGSMAKNDISDGFYNVFVNSNGVKNFGCHPANVSGARISRPVLPHPSDGMGITTTPFSASSQKPPLLIPQMASTPEA